MVMDEAHLAVLMSATNPYLRSIAMSMRCEMRSDRYRAAQYDDEVRAILRMAKNHRAWIQGSSGVRHMSHVRGSLRK